VVDDVEPEPSKLVLEPRQPDVAGGTTAIAVDQDRFGHRRQPRILPEEPVDGLIFTTM
jgi:hypothetical protein